MSVDDYIQSKTVGASELADCSDTKWWVLELCCFPSPFIIDLSSGVIDELLLRALSVQHHVNIHVFVPYTTAQWIKFSPHPTEISTKTWNIVWANNRFDSLSRAAPRKVTSLGAQVVSRPRKRVQTCE